MASKSIIGAFSPVSLSKRNISYKFTWWNSFGWTKSSGHHGLRHCTGNKNSSCVFIKYNRKRWQFVTHQASSHSEQCVGRNKIPEGGKPSITWDTNQSLSQYSRDSDSDLCLSFDQIKTVQTHAVPRKHKSSLASGHTSKEVKDIAWQLRKVSITLFFTWSKRALHELGARGQQSGAVQHWIVKMASGQ